MGICVTQFDPKQVERCLVASPGYLPTLGGEGTSVLYHDNFLNFSMYVAGIVRVQKVSYHKFPCTTGAKFHGIHTVHWWSCVSLPQ